MFTRAFAGAVIGWVVCSQVSAQDVTVEKFEIIADFADRLCLEVPLEGVTTELGGKAEADLGAILRRLVNVGVEGAVDFDVRKYSGFAQEDLLSAVRSRTECNLVIWRDLEKRIFEAEDQSSLIDCEPPGGVSGNSAQRADLFTNRGIEHDRRGEYAQAVAGFEMALSFTPSSIINLLNLTKVHQRWEDGNRDQAYVYVGRAINVMREAMRNIDLAAIERIKGFQKLRPDMTCAQRSELTGENFRTDVWYRRAGMYLEDAEPEKAISDISEIIRIYPIQSCDHMQKVGRAFIERAYLQCRQNSVEAAVKDYSKAAAMGVFMNKRAIKVLQDLTGAKYYTGPIDGKFGRGSLTALMLWVRDGCPDFS